MKARGTESNLKGDFDSNDELDYVLGWTTPETTEIEHIFVAVINFSPFFCADIYDTNLLLIVCALNDM